VRLINIFKKYLTQTTEQWISHLYSSLAEFFNCFRISWLQHQNVCSLGVKEREYRRTTWTKKMDQSNVSKPLLPCSALRWHPPSLHTWQVQHVLLGKNILIRVGNNQEMKETPRAFLQALPPSSQEACHQKHICMSNVLAHFRRRLHTCSNATIWNISDIKKWARNWIYTGLIPASSNLMVRLNMPSTWLPRKKEKTH
jgi:hypothetical protein